jgi:hypothetical protein
VPSISDDLACRGAPLEYWFIKLHAGDLAFLVDFIVRRGTGEAEVRLSLWVRGRGRVEHHRATAWRAAKDQVVVGDCAFTASTSQGSVADIEWDVEYDGGRSRVAPRVPGLSRLHPFDLELTSRPRSRFGGHVTVAGERFDLSDAPGSVTHYWGRRLPDRWHWISANAFGDGDLVVEAVVMRTRFWGTGPAMSAGYLWTGEAGREHTLVSPLNGIMSVSGEPHDFTVLAHEPRGVTRLRCTAAPARYNDLGEGIHQTLLGTCAIVRSGLTDRCAGLEFRNWP